VKKRVWCSHIAYGYEGIVGIQLDMDSGTLNFLRKDGEIYEHQKVDTTTSIFPIFSVLSGYSILLHPRFTQNDGDWKFGENLKVKY
jgi:hypothetical protein